MFNHSKINYRIFPYCKKCGSSNYLKFIYGNDEPTSHYGRIVCSRCNDRFIKWIPKPKPIPKRGFFNF